MDWLVIISILAASYVVGSIPFGLVVVHIAIGKDVRKLGSGRTGGTNVMRAAGFIAGAVTAVLDLLKGGAGIWLASWLMPGQVWLQVAAGALGVWGSIRSIFLQEKDVSGKVHLRGGAGGAAVFGAVTALWIYAPLYLFPIAAVVFVLIGYASITTISIAVAGTGLLVIRALTANAPWEHIILGVISIGMVLFALRPNLKRLREGTEREVGLRAYLSKQKLARQAALAAQKTSAADKSPTQPQVLRAEPTLFRQQ